MIKKLIRLTAIKGWKDGLAKWTLFYLLILGFDLVIEYTLVGDLDNRFWRLAAVVLFVSTPFVWLAFALVTHLDNLQFQLAKLAATDMLTGLPNRRAFFEKAQQAHLNGQNGVLLVLDADHFKQINDTYGHATGDSCLCAIADHLRGRLRADDIVGRLGGEEFGIFLPNVSMEEATEIAEQMTQRISVKPDGDSEQLNLTMSIGGERQRTDLELDQLYRRADLALYAAKKAGRARFFWWRPDIAPTTEITGDIEHTLMPPRKTA